MGDYRGQIANIIIYLVLGGVIALLLRLLHQQWWKSSPRLRRATWMVPLGGILLSGVWALLQFLEFTPPIYFIALLSSFLSITFLTLVIFLPLSGVVLSIARLVEWVKKKDLGRKSEEKREEIVATEVGAPEVDLGRRSLITTGTMAVPMFAIGASGVGVIRSKGGYQFTPVDMVYPGLHPDLEGLKIMQISDLHLGYFVQLSDLERLLQEAEPHKPDLVTVTGDLSDDLTVFSDALKMIGDLNPQHGTFASLGNHEYYRGINDVRRAFDKGPIPLLVDQGEALKIGRGTLYVGGVDDPVKAGEFTDTHEFLQGAVDRTLNGAPSDAFHLMLTHRPEGFDPAAANGVDLTLAGHTHAGGQMGWNGRSFVETWLGMGKYMWGLYEKNDGAERLYTSAGAGHWLPFRLGVPREVPIYTLRRGPRA